VATLWCQRQIWQGLMPHLSLFRFNAVNKFDCISFIIKIMAIFGYQLERFVTINAVTKLSVSMLPIRGRLSPLVLELERKNGELISNTIKVKRQICPCA
jgi:hypothetical protein